MPWDMKDFGLTRHEEIFEEISPERLAEMIGQPGVKVTDCRRTYNTYGEFRFITLQIGEQVYAFWGLGYHEYRDTYQDYFKFHRSEIRSDMTWPTKSSVLELLKEEAAEYRLLAKDYTPSYEGTVYDMLAEAGDEDSAVTDMEDFFSF